MLSPNICVADQARSIRSTWLNFLTALLVISLPIEATAATSGAGTTPAQFSVSQSGAASYTVPIEVPPGINGIQPKLALVYNSQRANGLLGVGWSLSGLSAISRCPANVATDGFRAGIEVDVERFCLDGVRLIRTGSGSDESGDYVEFRTELESFTKVRAYGVIVGAEDYSAPDPDYFKAWTKAGLVKEYGEDPYSVKGFGTGEDSIVFSWGLNRIEDKNGNYLDIRYAANYATGEFYPEVINYGASDNSAKWYVHFGYEDRTDIIKNHIAGRSLSITKRLSSLTTSRGNQPNLSPIRNYILHY